MPKTYEITDGILYEVITTIEKKSVSSDALKARKFVLQAEMDSLDAEVTEIEAEEAKIGKEPPKDGGGGEEPLP